MQGERGSLPSAQARAKSVRDQSAIDFATLQGCTLPHYLGSDVLNNPCTVVSSIDTFDIRNLVILQ